MSQFNECPFCGKTEFKHAGARNLHLMHCELKTLRNGAKEKKKEEKCSHSWRLLSEGNSLEKMAIDAGYTKVCTKCEEVTK